MDRYWIKKGDKAWEEVSQAAFVDAERNAGFQPKPGCGPLATAGFSGGTPTIKGRITSSQSAEQDWGHDPEFEAVFKSAL